MQVVKLNNGRDYPLVGLGTNTFGKVNNNWNGEINFETKEIESALKVGYRFLDTAIVYRNEEVVGLGVKRSGLPRHEVILQTKLPSVGNYIKDEQGIRDAVEESLKKLGTDYIDAYLMHQPRPTDEENLNIYQVLEKLVDEGKILTLGVSNFSIAQLDYLLKHSRIKPSINQIEIHPGHWNNELVDFCQKHGVLVQAWSPLFRTSDADKETLKVIGEKHKKSWAQVVINYLVSKGIMVITKSHDQMRQLENLSVFDFSLSEKENQRIASLNTPNFHRLAVLGGTGFVGRTLTIEALRLGYEVINISLDAKIIPQKHLEMMKHDLMDIETIEDKLKDVDTIISCLNDEVGERYLTLHTNALNLAKKLNKPLVVIGTYSTLLLEDGKTSVYATLDEKTRSEEKHRVQLLEVLNNELEARWTYLSPSIVITKNGFHHDFNLGGKFLLKDAQGNSEVSLIDLVDFALSISSNQRNFNHQVVTIANR